MSDALPLRPVSANSSFPNQQQNPSPASRRRRRARSRAPPDGAMPRRLPDELLEEVLRRLPPHEPAMLVRAALVSRRWCRLVSGAGFRRRFREFHRSPPMLGMLCNHQYYDVADPTSFIPTTAFCTPRKTFLHMSVLDARHGRVLLRWYGLTLVVWDPIADKKRELAIPQKSKWATWTAAVLCSAAAAGGACDHLDCHQGPFLVVFVSKNEDGNAVVYTYSSDTAAWSECICSQQKYSANSWPGSALVGNSLYFGNGGLLGTALKYDLELRQVSLVLLPSLRQRVLRESVLTTMEDDGGLWLVNTDDSKLYMWLWKDTPEVDAKWESRVIELKTVFPVGVDVSRLGVLGSGVGIIFMRTGDKREVYTIDLKTYEVKKVYDGSTNKVIPFMSFYTPCSIGGGEEPNPGGSSA